jgi:hypothetical protein
MTKAEQSGSPSRGRGLIVLAWIASLAALPVCFFAVVGWGMSPSGPHAAPGELLMLVAGPVVAVAALVWVGRSGRITGKRFAAMFFPGILALAELAFTLMVWSAG